MRKEIVSALIDDAARRAREARMVAAIEAAARKGVRRSLSEGELYALHAERLAERRRRNGN